MRNLDKVLLGKFYGSEFLGSYERAYRLSMMPLNQLLTPLHSVALTTLSRLNDDRKRFITYYTKAISLIAFLGSILAVILMLTAKDLILLLLGPGWGVAGQVVMALSPGIAALFVYGTHSWLHLSLGTPNRWLQWNIFATIVTVTAFIIAAPYGAVAMGIAYSARAFVLVVPALWYAGRPIQLGLKNLLFSIWPYFLSAILITASWLYLFSHCMAFHNFLSNLNLIIRIVTITCTTSFIYLILVSAMERSFKSFYEIISLIKLFLKRT
jgi:PST family polysaccharide transporter